MSVFNASFSGAARGGPQGHNKRPRYLWILLVLACLLGALASCKAAKPNPMLGCPGEIPVSQEAADRVAAKFRKATQGGGSVRVSVSNEEATSFLNLRQRVIPLQNAKICFKPGQIRLEGQLGGQGKYTVQATLASSVHDGLVQVQVVAIAVNGLALPGWARSSIEKPINKALADARRRFRVEEVSPGDGSLLVVGSME